MNKKMKRSLKESKQASMAEYQKLLADYCENNKYQFEKKDGYYIYTVDIDYRDGLEPATIAEILDSGAPMEKFYELIDQAYDYFWQEEEYILSEFNEYLTSNGYEQIDEDMWQEIRDIVAIEPDYNAFLGQNYNCIIMVDSGDANYDFSLNPNYYSNYTFDDEEAENKKAGIVWLANQQGYSYEQVKAALDSGDKVNDKFLNSIVTECYNTTSSMNAVTFLVTATLGDLVNHKESKTGIEVSQNAMCGLFDSWGGGGSVLDIDLVKPVVIPYANVWCFTVDENKSVNGRYSVNDVYGMSSAAYKGSVKLIGGTPKTESTRTTKSGKVLTEGAGAGYSIDCKGFSFEPSTNGLIGVTIEVTGDSPYEEYILNCETNYNGTVDAVCAESYMYRGEVNNQPVKCTKVQIVSDRKELISYEIAEVDEDEEITVDSLNKEILANTIIDALDTASSSIIYGGGWKHSTYDGTLSEITEKDSSFISNYPDIKADINLLDKLAIDYIDKAVTGDNIYEYYIVINDDGEEINDYDELEDAIAYAEENEGVEVKRLYGYYIFDGFPDDYESESAWVRESVKTNNKESKLLGESFNKKKEAVKKINITESLNNIDKNTDNKYDLLTAYQCHSASEEFSKGLVERLAKKVPAKAIYEYLMDEDTPEYKLAVDIDKFLDDFDHYEYMNTIEFGDDRDSLVRRCLDDIHNGTMLTSLRGLKADIEEEMDGEDDDYYGSLITDIDLLIARLCKLTGDCIEESKGILGKDYVLKVKSNDFPEETIRLIASNDEDAKEYAKKRYLDKGHNIYADDRHNNWDIKIVSGGDERISESLDDKDIDYTKLFEEFLDTIEFELVKGTDGYRLRDLQNANLGNIESERFKNATEIVDALSMYIEDYFITDYDNELEAYDIDTTGIALNTWEDYASLGKNKELQQKYPEFFKSHEFEIIDMIVNHTNDVDLSKVAVVE